MGRFDLPFLFTLLISVGLTNELEPRKWSLVLSLEISEWRHNDDPRESLVSGEMMMSS